MRNSILITVIAACAALPAFAGGGSTPPQGSQNVEVGVTVNPAPVTATGSATSTASANPHQSLISNPIATGGKATGGDATATNSIGSIGGGSSSSTAKAEGGQGGSGGNSVLHGIVTGTNTNTATGGSLKDSGNSASSASLTVAPGAIQGHTSSSSSASTGASTARVEGSGNASVGNLSTGAATATNEGVNASGNLNTVNVGGDTYNSQYSYPRQNPGAFAAPLPPVVCAKSGASVSISSPVVSIAFSNTESEMRCFSTAEANSCVAAAISAATALNIVRPLRQVAVRCLTRMPVMMDIARDLQQKPDEFADAILMAASNEDRAEQDALKRAADAKEAREKERQHHAAQIADLQERVRLAEERAKSESFRAQLFERGLEAERAMERTISARKKKKELPPK